MNALARTRRAIEAAWLAFVAGGDVPLPVRPEIRRSWERARRHVDPRLLASPSVASPAEVLERAGDAEAFRIAAPLAREFGGRLAGDGHVVGYFDADGVMVTLEGNHRSRDRLARVNFAPGARWGERDAGTNGPGTALAEGRPVEVFAAEHFVEAWQPWTCASVPVRAGGAIVGVVDITSPWEAHSPALLLTAEALARTIEARLEAAEARQASRALARSAAAALGARDEFLAAASHELRTPLTPLQLKIQGLRRAVERRGGALDPARVAAVLRGAEGDLRRVVAAIDELLEASGALREPAEVDPCTTDLVAVVRRVVDRHRGELERRGCEVRLGCAAEVTGCWDARRLEEAVAHLLVNAMTYAPGPITIAIEADDALARLVVRDGGPGIAACDRERIFLPYERAAPLCNVAGYGLGLHVVRCVAEAHGGAARVESVAGGGSAFVLELPREAGARDTSGLALPAH